MDTWLSHFINIHFKRFVVVDDKLQVDSKCICSWHINWLRSVMHVGWMASVLLWKRLDSSVIYYYYYQGIKPSSHVASEKRIMKGRKSQ